jgi:hypothetical protein
MLASVALALGLAAAGPGEACVAGPPLVADPGAQSVPLAGHLEVLEDERHELSLAEVASPRGAGCSTCGSRGSSRAPRAPRPSCASSSATAAQGFAAPDLAASRRGTTPPAAPRS